MSQPNDKRELFSQLKLILTSRADDPKALVSILADSIYIFGDLSDDVIVYVARRRDITPEAARAAIPAAREQVARLSCENVIRVCTGPFCRPAGGNEFFQWLEGRTQSLQDKDHPLCAARVYTSQCLGHCEKAPVLSINRQPKFKVTKAGLKQELDL